MYVINEAEIIIGITGTVIASWLWEHGLKRTTFPFNHEFLGVDVEFGETD